MPRLTTCISLQLLMIIYLFSFDGVHPLNHGATHPIEPLAPCLGGLLILAGSSGASSSPLQGAAMRQAWPASSRPNLRRQVWSRAFSPAQPCRQRPTRARPTDESRAKVEAPSGTPRPSYPASRHGFARYPERPRIAFNFGLNGPLAIAV